MEPPFLFVVWADIKRAAIQSLGRLDAMHKEEQMEKGEVGYFRPEFTPEELKALEGGGEEEQAPEKPEAETKEPEKEPEKELEQEPEKKPEAEQTQDTSAPEKKPDAPEETEDKKDPVQKRIDKLTWEKNEVTRKHNLLIELGQEEYFKRYPEETPPTYRKPEPKQPQFAPVDLNKMGQMQVQGGEYNGMTLNEVYSIDPAQATLIRDRFINAYNQQIQRVQQAASVEREKASVFQEAGNFIAVRAVDLFDKDFDDTTDEDKEKLATLLNDVVNWQTKNKLGKLPLEVAYTRMVKEQRKQKEEVAKKTLEHADQKAVGSIGTGKVAGQLTGYESDMTMTEAQLATKIDSIPRAEYKVWYKNAPAALRKKYPDLF